MRNSKVNMTESGKILRKLRGIRTRSGVSRETGIPYSTLQSYEDGKREPTKPVKRKLSAYYGVREDDIFLPITTTISNAKHKGER